MLIIKGLLGGVFQIILFTALLFVPAGTWYWPRAIAFLVVYGILVIVSTFVLARTAPASLEARLQKPIAKSQPFADRVITSLLFFFLLAWFASIPVEVFHLRLLPPPRLIVSIIGTILFFVGYGIVLIAIYQNAFAAPIVKDQSDRGQVLIDAGLYSYIRHPFYLGFCFFLIGIALWLESYMSAFLLIFVFAILVARIIVEEKTLRDTLPGYTEYIKRVRYRLIPFVW